MLTALRTNHFAGAPCTRLPVEKRDLFHPSAGGAYKVAKRLCDGCEVKQKCLEWALRWEHPEERVGVYGGLSARERERLFANAPRRHEVQCLEGHPRINGEEECAQCRIDARRRKQVCTPTAHAKDGDEAWYAVATKLRRSHPAPAEYPNNDRLSSKHDYETEQT